MKDKVLVAYANVSKATANEMNRILTLEAGETTIEDAGYIEDSTVLIKTVQFSDGYTADIRVEAGQSNFYLNPILYDQYGDEITYIDADCFVGEYDFEDSDLSDEGIKHIAIIRIIK